MSVTLFDRLAGVSAPPLIVAEMSGNHNGDLERALAIVDAAAEGAAKEARCCPRRHPRGGEYERGGEALRVRPDRREPRGRPRAIIVCKSDIRTSNTRATARVL